MDGFSSWGWKKTKTKLILLQWAINLGTNKSVFFSHQQIAVSRPWNHWHSASGKDCIANSEILNHNVLPKTIDKLVIVKKYIVSRLGFDLASWIPPLWIWHASNCYGLVFISCILFWFWVLSPPLPCDWYVKSCCKVLSCPLNPGHAFEFCLQYFLILILSRVFSSRLWTCPIWCYLTVLQLLLQGLLDYAN